MTIPLRSATGRGILAATVLGSGMVFLDGTIVTVAVRRIGQDFNAGFGELQWVVNGYTLALASLILLGGSLGDRLGRKRVYLFGVVWFAIASVGCALAPNVEMLIAARAVQGIGGALLTPGSLAIISATIAGADRARAIGIWSGLSGVSTAVGPLLGGWLVQDISWRWAFAINVPIAVGVIVIGLRHIPPDCGEAHEANLDISGTVLVALGLGLVTYGTIAAGDQGWAATTSTLTAAGVLLLGAFLLLERRAADPLVPLDLFRDSTFSGANLMTFMTYGALSAIAFTLTINLQVSAGYGPLKAGLATLPITILMLLLSPASGSLSARIGPRLQMTVGPLLAAAGILLTMRIDASHHNYVTDVLPGVLLFGLGLTSLVAPLTSTVMSAAPRQQVGIASGVNNAIARTASLLAVAVLPTAAGLVGEAYRQVDVMVRGYRIVAASCAGLLVLASIVVILTVRAQPERQSEPEPTGQATARR